MPAATEPLRLIGNPEENFYILGKKHHAQYRQLHATLNPEAATLMGQWRSLTGAWKTKSPEPVANGAFDQWVKAYCEGLEVPVLSYLAFLDQLEGHLLPSRGTLAGCTSVFTWDEEMQKVEHLRLLDWPLNLVPNESVEILYVHVPKCQALMMVCVPGLPFLPLTMMNEAGLTLAMHAKYHPLRHPEGVNVGKIAIESMLEARTVAELKKHLKRHQTKQLWGFHSCDPSGQVLAMDVMGPQMDGQSYETHEEKILVFNNAPLIKDVQSQAKAEPPAFTDFCRERRRWCLEKLSATGESSGLIKLTKATKVGKYRAPAVALNTIQALSLYPAARRLEMLVGKTPQWAQGKVVVWNDLFVSKMKNPELQTFSYNKEEQAEWDVRHELSEAQKAMDLGDVSLAFHRIQMGLVKASGELRAQAQWVWAWWQWRHLNGKRDRMHLPHLINETLKHTPASHRPHLKFLMFLLEMELDLVPTVSPPEMPTPFREWSDSYLLGTPLKKREMLASLDARLDIQDCLPLLSSGK